jgi:hypothetical protein
VEMWVAQSRPPSQPAGGLASTTVKAVQDGDLAEIAAKAESL